MTPVTLTGQEDLAVWQIMADHYSQFAASEGVVMQVRANSLRAACAAHRPGYNLARLDNQGFLAWTTFGEQVEILDLYISPATRRQGAASAAIDWLRAHHQPARRMLVDVNNRNQVAQDFYLAQGFLDAQATLYFPPFGAGQRLDTQASYYDTESDSWLAATWPTIVRTTTQLDRAKRGYAQRLWLANSFEQNASSWYAWPRHPHAMRMIKQ